MKTTAGENKIIDAHLEAKDRLRPCPFCGGAGQLAHTWTASYWIECSVCGAEARGKYEGKDYIRRAHIQAARSALNAWNARV